ncbi:MAG: hypothetical protein IPP26_06225 [Flavobacteriales bacterium]|nr:hypothetical protein [Flavobacteriales bacterium]
MEPRLPAALAVVADLPVESPTTTWRIHVARPTFTAYRGMETVDSFGGKDLLLVDGRPQFAEVAILRAFKAAGLGGALGGNLSATRNVACPVARVETGGTSWFRSATHH